MQKLDMAVVGSGIGGSLISALNAKKDLVLFEKDKNLGGCASTFQRGGNFYNAGATTLFGYEKGHVLKKHFDEIGLVPNVSKSDVAFRIIQNETILDRTTDFEFFLEEIERIYPNKNNQYFWKKLKNIDEAFWKLHNVYYAKHSMKHYIKTVNFITELFKTFHFDVLKSAKGFIKETLGDISQEYQDFIDAQLLITVQSSSQNVSMLSLALGLSYPFHDVFYVYGGMGSLIDDIVKDVQVHAQEEIKKIVRLSDGWQVFSDQQTYKTDLIVLNSSIYQCSKLFEDPKIRRYYDKFQFSDQSAFVVYMNIESKVKFLDHYQIILDECIPNAISKSFFVSISREDDERLSKKGYSVTISTHTTSSIWRQMSAQQYKEEKQKTMDFIVAKLLENFSDLAAEDLKRVFCATTNTFQNYIGRYNCGGSAINMKNFAQIPSCNTPFQGLYNVGDTVFAGQGWPGIALGVDILNRELNGID